MEINLCMGCMRKWEGTGACPYCGFELSGYIPSPHHLPPGTVLAGKYLTGRSIGEGGFGITYIGWDLNLETRVAIKEYFPEGFVTRRAGESLSVRIDVSKDMDYYIQGREKFLKEARALAKLDNTPGIVRIKDYFQENETAYLVMEYLDGITLKRYVEQAGGRLPTARVLEIAYPLMEALYKVHEAGILHRDISPDNIMVMGDGRVKLMDFGSAKDLLNDGSRQSRAVMLKPGYAPPEQYQVNALQGPWIDVYALCATIYYCVTGTTVVQSIDRLMSGIAVPLPEEQGADMSPAQSRALMKGLALEANERYQNMEQLFQGLSQVPVTEGQPGERADAGAGLDIGKSHGRGRDTLTGPSGFPFRLASAVAVCAVVAALLWGAAQQGRSGSDKPVSGYPPSIPTVSTDSHGGGWDNPTGTAGIAPQQGQDHGDKAAAPSLSRDWTEEEARNMKEYGSLPANIANGGRMIVRDSVIYGADSNDGLICMMADSRRRIARRGSCMNLMDGLLYYWNSLDMGIYVAAVDMEDRQERRIGDVRSSGCVSVVDDWIYYLDQKGRPSRMRTDGTAVKCLSERPAAQLQAWDGWLYYIDHGRGGRIFRMRSDGSGTEELTQGEAVCFAVEDGIIYGSDQDGIWKKEADSGTLSPLSVHPASAVNVYDGIVYCVDAKDGLLYRVEPDGGRKALSDIPVLPAICADGTSVYCIRKTGSTCGQAFVYSADGETGLVFTASAQIYGNTGGNCVNYGTMAVAGDGRAHGMMADGNLYWDILSDEPELLAYQSWELNTDREYVYYVMEENDREAAIYREPLDGGKEAECLLKLSSPSGGMAIRYLSLVDGLLYYGWKQGEEIYPCRLEPDTGKNERLNNENCWSMNVYEGWIYYLDGERGLPYRMKLDSGERVRLYDKPARALAISEGVMYLALDDAIVKMWPDGSSAETVDWVSASFLNVCGGWIFYGDRDDGVRLYRLSTDGTRKDLICSDGVKWVNAVPAVDDICLVYYWDTEDNKPYLSRPDGSSWVALEVNGG